MCPDNIEGYPALKVLTEVRRVGAYRTADNEVRPTETVWRHKLVTEGIGSQRVPHLQDDRR